MILQALNNYYETLLAKGKITAPGWVNARISFALDIDSEGHLKRVLSLETEETSNNKTFKVMRVMALPQGEKRSIGVKAQFLWDNGQYLLGLGDGKAERARRCFDATKEKCHAVLAGADGTVATALKAFFDTWQPENAAENDILKPYLNRLAGANITFCVKRRFAVDDEQVRCAWNSFYRTIGAGKTAFCSVTGRREPVARLHPSIKGVSGAKSSGASLVSFNEVAFNSYGFKQGDNAHVGESAAFAYTTALNMLLSDEKHCTRIEDVTVVHWTEDAQDESSEAMGFSFIDIGKNRTISADALKTFMESIASGKPADFKGVPVNPDNRFYVLGISPNSARLSVRFFVTGTLKEFFANIVRHFEDLEIVRPSYDPSVMLPLWRIVLETANKNAKDKGLHHLTGAVMRSVLTGSRYPAALYQGILTRAMADRDNDSDDNSKRTEKIGRIKAAVIKACLIRNFHMEEVATLGLNEGTRNLSYVLGRLFAVLEQLQKESGAPGNTIKDRYFNAACTRPVAVFPLLLKLGNHHKRKLESVGRRIYFEKLIGELLDKVEMGKNPLPSFQPDKEQMAFILGYYHQTQKWYEPKADKPAKIGLKEKPTANAWAEAGKEPETETVD